MEIKYLGHASFLIKTKTAKIVTDPFDSDFIGMKFPKTEADIITVSHQHSDHNHVKNVSQNGETKPLVIDMPGEFEKLGVRIFGFNSYHDKTHGSERGENIMYKFEAEGLSVLHCGDLGVVPDDAFLDVIGEVDILMVPVGGFYTINADEAIQLIKKVEPAIVIPMHFGHDKLKSDLASKLSPLSEFTKKFGLDPVPMPKLVYKKEEIEQEMKVVVLEI